MPLFPRSTAIDIDWLDYEMRFRGFIDSFQIELPFSAISHCFIDIFLQLIFLHLDV